MSNTLKFSGVYTALITPFNTDGSVDFPCLKDLVEWQIEQGIDGLVPAGTTGESPTLSHEEHYEVIKAVVEQTNGRVPIIAGTGSNNTEEAIMLTRDAAKLGVSASLQVSPYYNKPSQEGYYRHFSSIAEAVALPQVLYNIPGRTGKNMDIETIYRLLDHPLIVGIKEATGNISYSLDILHHNKDISVLSGDDNLSLATIAHGGHGVISVASNIIPKQMLEMIHTAQENDFVKAREKFDRLLPLFKAMFVDSNPIPVKYAASKMNLCKEVYRLPLCELGNEDKKLLDSIVQSFNLNQQ